MRHRDLSPITTTQLQQTDAEAQQLCPGQLFEHRERPNLQVLVLAEVRGALLALPSSSGTRRILPHRGLGRSPGQTREETKARKHNQERSAIFKRAQLHPSWSRKTPVGEWMLLLGCAGATQGGHNGLMGQQWGHQLAHEPAWGSPGWAPQAGFSISPSSEHLNRHKF